MQILTCKIRILVGLLDQFARTSGFARFGRFDFNPCVPLKVRARFDILPNDERERNVAGTCTCRTIKSYKVQGNHLKVDICVETLERMRHLWGPVSAYFSHVHTWESTLTQTHCHTYTNCNIYSYSYVTILQGRRKRSGQSGFGLTNIIWRDKGHCDTSNLWPDWEYLIQALFVGVWIQPAN